jgi:hypothetical protein
MPPRLVGYAVAPALRSEALGLVADPGQIDRSAGAEVRDHGALVAGAGNERLPAGQVLEPVEVPRRDRG